MSNSHALSIASDSSALFTQMCVFLCMGGNNTTWMNTTVLVTCIRNFRKNIGPVSGILKWFIRLSIVIFIDLCFALFTDDPASFLLMLSLIPFAICLIGIFFLREAPSASIADNQEKESKYFGILNVVAVYLQAFGFVQNPSQLVSIIFICGLLVLSATSLAIPVHFCFRMLSSGQFKPILDVKGHGKEPLLGNGEMGRKETTVVVATAIVAEEGQSDAMENKRVEFD